MLGMIARHNEGDCMAIGMGEADGEIYEPDFGRALERAAMQRYERFAASVR